MYSKIGKWELQRTRYIICFISLNIYYIFSPHIHPEKIFIHLDSCVNISLDETITEKEGYILINLYDWKNSFICSINDVEEEDIGNDFSYLRYVEDFGRGWIYLCYADHHLAGIKVGFFPEKKMGTKSLYSEPITLCDQSIAKTCDYNIYRNRKRVIQSRIDIFEGITSYHIELNLPKTGVTFKRLYICHIGYETIFAMAKRDRTLELSVDLNRIAVNDKINMLELFISDFSLISSSIHILYVENEVSYIVSTVIKLEGGACSLTVRNDQVFYNIKSNFELISIHLYYSTKGHLTLRQNSAHFASETTYTKMDIFQVVTNEFVKIESDQVDKLVLCLELHLKYRVEFTYDVCMFVDLTIKVMTSEPTTLAPKWHIPIEDFGTKIIITLVIVLIILLVIGIVLLLAYWKYKKIFISKVYANGFKFDKSQV